MRSSRSALAALVVAAAFGSLPELALAESQWRSGFLVYTPVQDIYTGYVENGTAYLVSQAYVSTPPQPRVGQVFYISALAAGIAVPVTGRYVGPYLQLPAGVSVVADPATPLRCYYRPMDGSGNAIEFTQQALLDTSFGASLRIAGCPQPSAAPLPVTTLAIGGQGVLIERRDPQATSRLWPMGGQAMFEFLVPVVSNKPLDGVSDGARLRVPTNSIQGDFGSLWAQPEIHLLVHPVEETASADMTVSALSSVTPNNPANRRVQARCSNLGPSTAQNATCGFSVAPAGALFSCTPGSPQATLAAGAFIDCWAEFAPSAEGDVIEASAGTSTPDPNLGNNAMALVIDPLPPPDSADMEVTSLEAVAATTPGTQGVRAVCTNLGPSAALDAHCGFTRLPAGAALACAPVSPQPSLAMNAVIECRADFVPSDNGDVIEASAGSSTPDARGENNKLTITFDASSGASIFADGFE